MLVLLLVLTMLAMGVQLNVSARINKDRPYVRVMTMPALFLVSGIALSLWFRSLFPFIFGVIWAILSLASSSVLELLNQEDR